MQKKTNNPELETAIRWRVDAAGDKPPAKSHAGQRLPGAKFVGIDLSGADFTGA